MSVDPGGLESGSDPQDPVIDFDEESTLDDNEVLDPIDEGDGDNDPDASIYDTSWVPDDRPSHRTDYGDTLTEMREGEPLDRRLAEDEPDLLEQELGDVMPRTTPTSRRTRTRGWRPRPTTTPRSGRRSPKRAATRTCRRPSSRSSSRGPVGWWSRTRVWSPTPRRT
jgi:hypothetical protein